MFNFLKRFFFKKKTEIELVEAALARYKKELNELIFDPEVDICCLGCKTGGRSTQLANKIERVERWLEVLHKRKLKRE